LFLHRLKRIFFPFFLVLDSREFLPAVILVVAVAVCSSARGTTC
jgi:hypothetical protein